MADRLTALPLVHPGHPIWKVLDVPEGKNTRSLRIPDDPWWPAKEQAARDRTSVNAVVVELLGLYAKHGRAWLLRAVEALEDDKESWS